MSSADNAVRAGLGVCHDTADHRDPGKASWDLPQKGTRLGVGNIDDSVRTISEIVGLGILVDPANVKAVKLAVCGIGRGAWDRNDIEQSNRPVTPCLVTLPPRLSPAAHAA